MTSGPRRSFFCAPWTAPTNCFSFTTSSALCVYLFRKIDNWWFSLFLKAAIVCARLSTVSAFRSLIEYSTIEFQSTRQSSNRKLESRMCSKRANHRALLSSIAFIAVRHRFGSSLALFSDTRWGQAGARFLWAPLHGSTKNFSLDVIKL